MDNNSSFSGVDVKKFIPGITWFLLVLVLICIPGEDIPKIEELDFLNFDKLVHAGLFGGIVFFFAMAYNKAALTQKEKLLVFLKITLATVIWGITTEFIQKIFIPGRQFDLLDWLADSLGAIAAFFVSRLFFARKKSDLLTKT